MSYYNFSKNKESIVIIGGLAAGMSAAAEARRVNSNAVIIVIEKLPFVTYAKCSLPHFIAGSAGSPLEEIKYTPEYFKEKRNIEVRVNCEALLINRVEKFVRVKELIDGVEYNISYDKLIIATGLIPDKISKSFTEDLKPENYFYLNDPFDAIAIDKYIRETGVSNAVIIGGGAIGLEMAWAFTRRNLNVTILERKYNILDGVSSELQELIIKKLDKNNVRLITNCGKLTPEFIGNKINFLVSNGVKINGDIFLYAAKMVPNIEIAENAGLEIGKSGGILVSNKMVTSHFNIYACGDCVEFKNRVNRKPVLGRIASTAVRSGYVAGSNCGGRFKKMSDILNPSLFKVFNYYCGETGLDRREAEEFLSNNFAVIQYESSELPTYMKLSNERFYIELYYDKSNLKVAGAALWGRKLLKRLDLITLIIREEISLDKIEDMDFVYTPDYSTSVDPIFFIARKAVEASKSR